ncbi:hypothetical protein [Desulforhopalus sp. 52FAK]
MTIKKLLDEISVIPGVTGSCVFNQSQKGLCRSTDTTIDQERLIKIGSSLMRMHEMGKMNGIEITGCHYRFNNCNVVSTSLGSDSALITFCDLQANCSLVAATASMLAADINVEIKKKIEEEANGTESEPATPTVEQIEQIDSHLQERLDQIEEALAEAIGPVASMVMEDHLTAWQKEGPAERSRLEALAELLYEELDDEVLLEEFKRHIQNLL